MLSRFYWPNVFGDVEEFCRTCAVRQKASHKGVGKAPLMPLPVISEPFSQVAMDIVGPLLTSRAGVLVVCDYATRYPEAIPLKSIDVEHVPEKLVELFARVGIPREILTDQGSNCVSQLLVEQVIKTFSKRERWLNIGIKGDGDIKSKGTRLLIE